MMNPGPNWLKKPNTDTAEENVNDWGEKSIPMYQCGLCCVKFQSPNELINHVDKGEHFKISKYDGCRDTEPEKEEVRKDIQTVTIDIASDENMEVGKACSVIVRPVSTATKSDPVLHFNDEPIEETGFNFEEPENLVKREQIESSSCDSAGVEFVHFDDGCHSSRLLEHTSPDVQERGSSLYYKCIKCSSTFDSVLGLKSHRSAHALECPYCGDAFYIKPSLDRHVREKHERESEAAENAIVTTFASDVLIEPTTDGCYGCTICGKICAARSDMSKHVRRHTDERPYSCTICSDRFKHRSAITNHMRIHTGEKPYSCLYCTKKFSQPSNKRRHEALHRGERPFSCDMCKRSFSEKTTLQTHMLQHTGERPFVCDVCRKGHITNSALTQHKRSRHQRLTDSPVPLDSEEVEVT